MSTAANWDGILTRRYGPLKNPTPPVNTYAERFPFIKKGMRGGDEFQHTIVTQLEHGVTRDNTRTSFNLAGAKDGKTAPARLRGSTINMQAEIPRDMLVAGMNGGTISGEFEDALDLKVLGLLEGAEFSRELDLHWGVGSGAAAATNIGVVSTIVSGTNLGAGGPIVCDLTRASWAAGIWNKMLGAYVDIYEADHTTLVAAEVEVTGVDTTLNRVTLAKSGSAADVDATDVIVPRLGLGMSCYGMGPILANTGSLFGINAATIPAWRAVAFSAAGAMTRAKILRMAARLNQNGLTTGGILFANGNTFGDLAEELSALQQYTNDKQKAWRAGPSQLMYQTNCGDIEVINDPFMKQGEAHFFAKDQGIRVGSSDITTETPGSTKWHFEQIPGKAGASLQAYACQAPLLELPFLCARVSGLTNGADTTPSA
jgi:hypothetical protein